MNNTNTFGQIQRDLTELVNQKVKEIEQKAKQQVASKIPLMQNEIYTQYSLFVKEYVAHYFEITYGATNYDEKSLLSSLNIKKNGFHPDFSYDSNKFKWNKDLEQDTEKFNIDSASISNYVDKTDELDDLEIAEDFYNDNIISDYIDYSSYNAKAQFNYYNKLNRQGAFMDLRQAYKIAYSEANKKFNSKLYNEIIPSMYKKYGIKLK